MTQAMTRTGNPSSVHAQGRAARASLESARQAVATLVGAEARNVIFTSGGTEADALGLWGAALADPTLKRLVVSAVEHDAVLANARLAAEKCGLTFECLPTDATGVADLSALKRLLAGGGRTMVALMAANNETGAVQPADEAAELIGAAGGLFFCDAVAAAGKMALPKADYLTLAGHKIGGPSGTGALIVADGVPFAPLIRGGGQEQLRRAGSENVVGLAGFGAAAATATREGANVANATERVRFEQGLRALCPEAVIFSETARRLWNTSLFALPGMAAETAIMALDLDGICVSRGAACSSGKVAVSHVLTAMGVDEALARCVLRISFGWSTKAGDAEKALASLSAFWRRSRRARAAA